VGSARERSRGSRASGKDDRGRAVAGARRTAGKYKDVVSGCATASLATQSARPLRNLRVKAAPLTVGRLGAGFFPLFGGERAWTFFGYSRLAWNAFSRRPAVDRDGLDPHLYAVPACAEEAVPSSRRDRKVPRRRRTSVGRGKLRLTWWLGEIISISSAVPQSKLGPAPFRGAGAEIRTGRLISHSPILTPRPQCSSPCVRSIDTSARRE